MTKFQHIVITGASSGIGRALAEHYASSDVTLSLTGRNEARLKNVVKNCQKKGAKVNYALLDVCDKETMKNWLLELDQEKPVDLIMANAGISSGTGKKENLENSEQIRRLFDVNFIGILNTIDPLLPFMKERGSGHIALMSSLAAYRGWPGAPAYCASKAAVKIYGEGLGGSLKNTGICVHVICPGFVESHITDTNDFPMPFIIPASKAAKIIANGIRKNKGRIAFPALPAFCTWFISVLPDKIAAKILQKMPAKKASS